jgi:hypothetical protein
MMVMMPDWLVALYAWQKKVRRQQQAWRWWYKQKNLQSHDIAEAIREGPLQQAFALRRALENGSWQVGGPDLKSTTALSSGHISPEQTAHWLETFQALYQTLASLSDQLSPPFIADSLPLALQYTLKHYTFRQLGNFELNFKVVPAHWPLDPSHKNQAILSTVTSLLALLLPRSDLNQPVNLILNCKNSLNILTIRLRPVDSLSDTSDEIAELPEVQHLKEIFHSLTAGHLAINQTATALIGRLYWQNEEIPFRDQIRNQRRATWQASCPPNT